MRPSALAFTAIACSATMAVAQPALFNFTGQVVEIENPDGLLADGDFVVGEGAGGSFSFDVSSQPFDGFDGFGGTLGLFEALTFSLSAGDDDFTTEVPLTAVFDDVLADSTDPDAPVIDALFVGGGLVGDGPNGPTRIGQIEVELIGDSVWYQGTDLPDASTLGFQNVLSATARIEFETIDGDFTDLDIFTNPDNFTVRRAAVIIELSSIQNVAGSTIATIGCIAAQVTAPVAVADLSDTSVFIDAFLASDASADLNRNGIVDLTDVDQFIDSFLTCR